MGEESPAIQEMLADPPEQLWLRPLRPSLTGHTGVVLAVAVYAGGQRAISASSDNTLKVWDLEEVHHQARPRLHCLFGSWCD